MTIKRYLHLFLVSVSMICTGSVFTGAYALELQRPCPSADAHQTGPQWSPDGSRYAFNAENSRQSTITICDISSRKELDIVSTSGGSPAEALLHDRNTEKSVTIVGFSWAPDSRHYAFVRSDKNDISKNGIYIGSIEQKTPAEDDPLIYDKSVATITWVPLGERESGIIYMTGNDIKLVSLDKSYSVKKSGLIFSSENRKGGPVLSHDGRSLIWTEDTLNGPKLFKCDMDGSAKCRNRARLTPEKTHYKELCPSVSPDNKYVAFYSNKDTTQEQEQGRIYTLWIVPSEGGNATKVSEHLVRGSTSPVLCPSWSGNKILYVAAETDEIWPVHEAVITVKNNQLHAENRTLFKSATIQGTAGSSPGKVAVADLSVSPASNTLVFSHQDFRNADGRFQMAWIDLKKAAVAEKNYLESQGIAQKAVARPDAARKEAAGLEAQRKETERRDVQRKEAERVEAARKEAERLDLQRKEAERVEAARKEAEQPAVPKEETPGIVSQSRQAGSNVSEYAHIHYAGVISKTSDSSNFTEEDKTAFEQGNASRRLGLGSNQGINEIDNLLSKAAEFHYYRYHLGEGGDILIVRTDSPDYYLEEFRDASMIEDLYEALKNSRVSSSRPVDSSAKSTVEWFNNLLEIPDLFEKVPEKKKSALMNKAIISLAEKTTSTRKKGFVEPGSTEQMLIKKLNRLIFEEAYAKESPKINERGYINVVRDDKDPSVYSIRLYDRQKTGAAQEEISGVAGGPGITNRLLKTVQEKTRPGQPNGTIHFLARKDWQYFFNYKQNWFHSESSHETTMAGIVLISGMKDNVSIKAVPVRNSFRRKEEMPFAKEEVRGYVMDTPYEWRVQIKP